MMKTLVHYFDHEETDERVCVRSSPDGRWELVCRPQSFKDTILFRPPLSCESAGKSLKNKTDTLWGSVWNNACVNAKVECVHVFVQNEEREKKVSELWNLYLLF